QCHTGFGMKYKAAVPRSGFTFGTCQCILGVRDRMQKHRKILADRYKSLCLHLLRRSPYNDVVAILDRHTEQGITYGTTYNIRLHLAHSVISFEWKSDASIRDLPA